MLKITRGQFEVFEQLSRQHFVDEMVNHLREFTPAHARSLRPERLRPIIELGIQRAHGHGFTQRGPVRSFIETMFLLGSDFDSDPQLPWAAAILGQPHEGEPQLDRARELYRATHNYQDVTAGLGGRHVLAGLRRARAGGLNPALDSRAEVDGQLLETLQVLGPEKSGYVGEQGLRALIGHGRRTARAHGALSVTDEALIVLLMFGLGHGCLTDPQFPWISAVLSTRDAGGPGDRFGRLRRLAMHFLGRTLENLSRRRGTQRAPGHDGARP